MKASLQLKLTQQLMLTPQLQQAIRLLQLSTVDLNQEIQEALEANPLLEITSDDHDITIAKRTDLPLTEGSVIVDRGPVEHYASSSAKKPFEGQANLEQLYSTTTSLHDHLLWQLQLTPFSELDYCIAGHPPIVWYQHGTPGPSRGFNRVRRGARQLAGYACDRSSAAFNR